MRMVKFKKLLDNLDGTQALKPVYIDLDSVIEIRPYEEEFPEYCEVMMTNGFIETIHVDIDQMAKLVNIKEPTEQSEKPKVREHVSLDDILTYTGPCLRCNTMPWWELNNYAGYETYTLSIHCHCAEASGTGKLGDDAVKLGWELAKKWKTKTSSN